MNQLCKHYKTDHRTVKKLFTQFNIPLRKKELNVPGERELRRMYHEEGLRMQEIADRVGVCVNVIRRAFRKNGIALRKRGIGWKRANFTEEQLRQYDKLTINEIARRHGVWRETIRRWLKHYGIKRPRRPVIRKPRFLKGELYESYIVKNLTIAQVASLYGVSKCTVFYWLRRYRLRKRFTTMRTDKLCQTA